MRNGDLGKQRPVLSVLHIARAVPQLQRHSLHIDHDRSVLNSAVMLERVTPEADTTVYASRLEWARNSPLPMCRFADREFCKRVSFRFDKDRQRRS